MPYHHLKIAALTQTMPPPYAFQCEMDFAWEGDKLKVKFSQEYISREELTAEEIEEEGFTANDDFKWEGHLGSNWWSVIEKLLAKTTVRRSKTSEISDPYFIQINADGVGVSALPIEGIPSEYEMWEYHIHELMQAVYEAGKKEKPLEIRLAKVTGKTVSNAYIYASFEHREASITTQKEDKETKEALPWDDLKSHLKTIYQPDYYLENANNTTPKKDGIYVSVEEGMWYQLGVAILEPSKKSSTLPKLEKLFDEIIS